jgi:LysM repeat protein
MVRWSWTSGYPDPRSALKSLLGTDNYQFKSSFPSYLPAIHLLTGVRKSTLIEQHTILPFFRMFCEDAVYQKAYNKILFGEAKDVHTRLSVVAGRLTQAHKMAYCDECVIEDTNHFGTVYWHREHQLPGQILCLRHSKRLKTTGVARRDFALPEDAAPADNVPITAQEIILSTILNKLLISTKHINTKTLKDTYKSELSTKGLTTASGRLRVKRLHSELKTYWSPIVHLPIYERIFECDTNNLFPASLFYSTQSVVHPLKHVLLIGMLFGSMSKLLAVCDGVTEHGMPTDTTKIKKTARQSSLAPKIRDGIVYGLQEGSSMRVLSSKYGTSISVIKKLAAQNSVKVQTRAHKLFRPEIDKIIEMATSGDSTQKIAHKFKCSVGAVEQIIGQQAGLVAYRREYRASGLKNAHRANILKAIERFKTRTEVRQCASASYTYLYKHDSAWLYDALPPAISRTKRYLGSKHV